MEKAFTIVLFLVISYDHSSAQEYFITRGDTDLFKLSICLNQDSNCGVMDANKPRNPIACTCVCNNGLKNVFGYLDKKWKCQENSDIRKLAATRQISTTNNPAYDQCSPVPEDPVYHTLEDPDTVKPEPVYNVLEGPVIEGTYQEDFGYDMLKGPESAHQHEYSSLETQDPHVHGSLRQSPEDNEGADKIESNYDVVGGIISREPPVYDVLEGPDDGQHVYDSLNSSTIAVRHLNRGHDNVLYDSTGDLIPLSKSSTA